MASDTLLILIGPATDASQDDHAALDQFRQAQPRVSERIGLKLTVRQAENDSQLRDWVATEAPRYAGLIINLAGCPAFDIDELLASPHTPVIEVRAHNPFKENERHEPLRRTQGPMAMVYGLGMQSYVVAINSAVNRLARPS